MSSVKHTKGFFVFTALVAGLTLFAGCASEQEESAAGSPPEIIGAEAEPGDADYAVPLPSAQTGGQDNEDAMEKDDIMVASPGVVHEDKNASSDQGNNADAGVQSPATSYEDRIPSPRISYDVNEPFDHSHPSLMGLTAGTTLEAVQARFGDPTDLFMLPDESSQAIVYSYPGFNVGISNGLVLFVEVNSPTVNPGLNGFRVGGKANKAVVSLGKPMTRTEYVLAYQGGGSILKLDIDPQSKTVQSIKLFPEDE